MKNGNQDILYKKKAVFNKMESLSNVDLIHSSGNTKVFRSYSREERARSSHKQAEVMMVW